MLWYLLTYVFLNVMHLTYQLAVAFVGNSAGAIVEHVSVGSWKVIKRKKFSWGWIPNYGYTKFSNEAMNTNGNVDDRVAFNSIALRRQIVILLAGPISCFVIAFVFLMIPICLDATQVVADSHGRWFMARGESTATWDGQWKLIKEWPLIVLENIRVDDPKPPRPDPAPFQIGGWCTTMGLVAFNVAVLNLIPMLPLNGGHIVRLAWEFCIGRPSERALIWLVVLGMFLLLATMLYVTYRLVRLVWLAGW